MRVAVFALVLVFAVSCSAPAANGIPASRSPDHPNRCYRMYDAGPYRESCLKQFPTGDAYTVSGQPYSSGL